MSIMIAGIITVVLFLCSVTINPQKSVSSYTAAPSLCMELGIFLYNGLITVYRSSLICRLIMFIKL